MDAIDYINFLIEKRDIHMEALAEAAKIKADILSRCLTRKCRLKNDQFIRLCLALSITPDDFKQKDA